MQVSPCKQYLQDPRRSLHARFDNSVAHVALIYDMISSTVYFLIARFNRGECNATGWDMRLGKIGGR